MHSRTKDKAKLAPLQHLSPISHSISFCSPLACFCSHILCLRDHVFCSITLFFAQFRFTSTSLPFALRWASTNLSFRLSSPHPLVSFQVHLLPPTFNVASPIAALFDPRHTEDKPPIFRRSGHPNRVYRTSETNAMDLVVPQVSQ